GHPGGGIRSFSNLKFSWLSREILTFSIYGGVLLLDVILRYNGRYDLFVQLIVLIAGSAALYSSARVYKNSGFPALNTFVPTFVFFCTAWVLGSCILGIVLPDGSYNHGLGLIFKTVLIVCLLGHFMIPLFWQTQGRVIKATAISNYTSIFFWGRAAILISITVFTLLQGVRFSIGVFLILLVSELAGRVLFFNNMVHASQNIGKPYY
ncbi:MAG: hypothetical protein L3J69_15000, partial [Desulfobacula sp.]|nr:hypothetical protein [Desulfobacula sp.]